MIRYKVGNLLALMRRESELEDRFADNAVLFSDRGLTEAEKRELLQLLIEGETCFLTEVAELEMLEGVTLVTNFSDRVRDSVPGYTCENVRSELQSLREYIENHLDSRLFLFIPTDQSQHYCSAPLETRHKGPCLK